MTLFTSRSNELQAEVTDLINIARTMHENINGVREAANLTLDSIVLCINTRCTSFTFQLLIQHYGKLHKTIFRNALLFIICYLTLCLILVFGTFEVLF